MENKKNLRHGKNGTPIYYTWGSMIKRCTNKNCWNYKNYGGRGIKVCERWLIFMNFYEDMGEKPEGLQLDRIDNNLGYFKENCRWATPSVNGANRRPYTNTGYKGVSYLDFRKRNKFQGYITLHGRSKHIGYFKTPELASLAVESCRWVLENSTPN